MGRVAGRRATDAVELRRERGVEAVAVVADVAVVA